MDDTPILICYDGSAASRRAIDVAAGLVGSRRAVVVDVEPYMSRAESLAVVAAEVSGPEVEDENRAEARRIAGEGAGLARAAGFVAEDRGELGDPAWEGIADVADEIDAAVIVVGAPGLTGLRGRFRNSTARDVVEHAWRPVLVVPPPS
jgi:nucleotide-binding universal stress UspA family protein